jgi:hypothetical protein
MSTAPVSCTGYSTRASQSRIPGEAARMTTARAKSVPKEHTAMTMGQPNLRGYGGGMSQRLGKKNKKRAKLSG